MTQIKLIFIVSLFFMLCDNYAFFNNILQVYVLNVHNIGFLISIGFIFVSLSALFFILLSSKWTTKPILIIVVLLSSLTSYFMNSYNVVIDDTMIRNTIQTDIHESMDLISLKQVLYFIFLGLIPAYFIYKIPICYRGWKKESLSKIKFIILSLLVIIISLFMFSKHYTSFFREHKSLRYSANPTYWIYSIGKYVDKTYPKKALF